VRGANMTEFYWDSFIKEHPDSINMLLYMLEQAYKSNTVK